MAPVLETVVQALAEAVPVIVSMPMPYDYPEPHGFGAVGPYGGPGQRRYQHSMKIDVGGPTDLLAMLGGTLTWLEPGTDVGPVHVRRDGRNVLYRTTLPALLLTVDPAGPVLGQARRAFDDLGPSEPGESWRPDDPLHLPPPHYVVYEGASLELVAGAFVPRVELFTGVPEAFPLPGDTFDDLSSSTVTDPLPVSERERWRTRLAAVRTLVQGDATLEVLLIGHLDSVGPEGLEAGLGQRRAELFLDTLNLGGRARALSRGQTQPLSVGTTNIQTGRLNRRIELIVRKRTPGAPDETPRTEGAPKVSAGAVIGRAGTVCSVTVLDEAGRFHDPLDVVRRYDREETFKAAWKESWFSPAIASGFVWILTPTDSTEPGVTDPAEAPPSFGLRRLDAASDGGAPILTDAHLADAEEGDLVWLPEVNAVRCALTVTVPLTFLGLALDANLGGVGDPELDPRATLRPLPPAAAPAADPFIAEPDDVPPRLIAFRALQDPDGIGVRLLGLRFSGASGGAVSVDGDEDAPLDAHDGTRPNVHVSTCGFEMNDAPGRANGGGLSLSYCGGVLVETSIFRNNTAAHGGAVFAESCRYVVVRGQPIRPRPPDEPPSTPDPVQAFEEFRLDLRPPTPGGDILGTADLAAGGLNRQMTGALFGSNVARGSGGALALVDTRFQVADVWFVGNRAGALGGAVAASQSEADIDHARRLTRPGETWPRCDRNAIVRCVSCADDARAGGGAVALVGPSDDVLVSMLGPTFEVDGARTLPAPVADGGFCHMDHNLILAASSFGLEVQSEDPSAATEDHPAYLGGGLLLAGGVYHLRGNRLHGNVATRCGGAVAALAGAQVLLESNLIDHNLVILAPRDASVVVLGGGAVYAHGAATDVPTRVWLSGNQVCDNNRARVLSGAGVVERPSEGDGGAVLAVCGAVVVCQRAAGSTPNAFLRNTAAWNGGAIAARNAEIVIGPGEAFEENRAETGDGGAIFVAGTRTGPAGIDVYQASIDAMLAPPCGRGGSRLTVEGTEAEPVVLQGNVAAQEGGAISVYQRPVLPIVPPAPDAPRSTVVDRTVGLVQSVALRHVRLSGNVSGEPPPLLDPDPPIGGSTIVLQDLDQGWRAAFDGLVFRAPSGAQFQGAEERDEWFGADVLRQHVLEDVQVELDGGVGVLLVRSDRVDLAGLSVTHAGGEPEGSTWLASQSVDVVRPVEP